MAGRMTAKSRAAARAPAASAMTDADDMPTHSRSYSASAMSLPFPASVDPFHSIRIRARSQDPHLVHANIVLAALTDVITTHGIIGDASQTQLVSAYFGALMLALENRTKQSVDSVTGTCYLLSLLFPLLPSTLLRSKFNDIADLLLSLIEEYTDENSITKSLLTCMETLLLALDYQSQTFHQSLPLKLVQCLLLHSSDSRPKLRHHAQSKLAAALTHIHGHYHQTLPKTVNDCIVSYSVRQLEQCTKKDCQEGLYLCNMLQVVIHLLSLTSISTVLESLLTTVASSQHRGNDVLFVQSMRTLVAFANRYNDDASPIKAKEYKQCLTFYRRLVTVMLGLVPHQANIECQQAYSQAVVAVMTHYHSVSTIDAANHLLPLFQRYSELLLSPKPTVTKLASDSVVVLMKRVVSAEWTTESGNDVDGIVKRAQSLLGYRYKSVWSSVFPIISALFEAFPPVAPNAFPSLTPLLTQLDSLHSNEEIVGEFEALIDECIGSAITYYSPASVMSVLPLSLPLTPNSDVSTFTAQLTQSRAYLLPLMRHYTRRTTLLTFFDELLPQCATLTELSNNTSHSTQHRAYQLLVEQLWETFPSFCLYPTDLASVLKSVAKTIGGWLSDPSLGSNVHAIVCRGLTLLIQKHRQVVLLHEHQAKQAKTTSDSNNDGEHDVDNDSDDEDNGNEDVDEEEEEMESSLTNKYADSNGKHAVDPATIPLAESQQCLSLLAAYTKNFLPLLFNLSSTITVKRDVVLDCIASFSLISDSATINLLFKRALKKWLESQSAAVVDDGGSLSHSLSDIILAMTNNLDSDNLTLLYQSIEPQLQSTADPVIQKKSYKILASICSHHQAFFVSHWKQLLSLITESVETLHPTALKYRLHCIKSLALPIPSVMIEDPSLIGEILALLPSLIGEVLLALKEPSFKTRTAAYDFVNAMGHACHQADQRLLAQGRLTEAQQWPLTAKNSDCPLLTEYIYMLLGGLASQTPHMQSSTIMAFSHLVFAFRHALPQSILEPLIPTLLPLLTTQSREVRKSMLGFIKVICLYLPFEFVRPHLPTIIPNLSDWGAERKNRFQEKIRIILEILIRKCSVDEIKALLPAQHHKLLDHIRKSKAREQRQKTEAWAARKSQRGADGDEEMGEKKQRVDFESVLYGSDNDSDGDNGNDAPARKTTKRRERSRDDGLSVSASVDNLLETGDMIKGLRKDKTQRSKPADADNDGKPKVRYQFKENKDGKLLVMEEPEQHRDEDDEQDDVPRRGKRRRDADADEEEQPRANKRAVPQAAGSQYRAKSGSAGDARRAGQKLEPYAYLPLNAQVLNKRKHKSATRSMESFVATATNNAKAQRTEQRMKNKARKEKQGGSGRR